MTNLSILVTTPDVQGELITIDNKEIIFKSDFCDLVTSPTL